MAGVVNAETWPPPADEASEWREFVPYDSREPVRARRVRLWGGDVFIDAAGDVWCPSCRRFRTVAELGRLGNGCPVGVAWPSGAVVSVEPGDDGPSPAHRPRLDFMRIPW